MSVICIINNKDQQRHYVNYYISKTDEVNSVSSSETIILPNVILESVYPGGRKRISAHFSKLQVLRFRYLYFGFVSLTLINVDGYEHAK